MTPLALLADHLREKPACHATGKPRSWRLSQRDQAIQAGAPMSWVCRAISRYLGMAHIWRGYGRRGGLACRERYEFAADDTGIRAASLART
ncbi:hypothetical protein GCM10010971_08780 [Silvimonas amylolytica]|uniref:Transposase n=1 Tax=Silvimonas amylolytica TaxID=449663 RepID=A0ABQ2PIG1_9NEIS|nr:hypothetical protein GCM10010971_08780 [Silvimonas amylolytica]